MTDYQVESEDLFENVRKLDRGKTLQRLVGFLEIAAARHLPRLLGQEAGDPSCAVN